MKKIGLGKRALACVVGAVTLLTGTTALSAVTQLEGMTVSAASYDNYAKLLQYSMYFYDANMCGDEVTETSLMDWRDDCHTSDEITGGFHDAGDHVKFGLPAGFSASTLGWGYYEFKDSYDALGQTAHLQTLTDYFCEYFKDCTVLSNGSVSKFCYQIGEGNADHNNYWGPPELQDASSRKAYWTTNSASDIAAEYAAALAANYVNFGNAEDLTYAKALYKFSTQYNSIATDGTSGFYDSSNYKDDQAWAAIWLYLATNDSTYKTDCSSRIEQYLGYSHCWNNVNLGATVLYAENGGSWSEITRWLNSECSDSSNYKCVSEWGSARLNTGLQLPALVASKYSGTDYTSWCKAQMGMILGNNSKNVNLIVGFDSNSAKNPHHRAASGYTSFEDMGQNTTLSSNSHVLVGALVGGPLSSDFSTYEDSLQNYKTNEVAIDYNAALVGAAAGLYSNYKTGSVDATVVGTRGSSVQTTATTSATTTAATTTTTSTTKAAVNTTTTTTTNGSTASGDTVLTNFTIGSEAGTDGNTYKYVIFDPSDADSATVYYNVSSSDTQTSGSFGTWNGSAWLQEDFDVSVPSGGAVSVDYTVPSDVGDTVKCSIYWPGVDSVDITKIVLHSGSSTVLDTTTTTTNTTAKSTATTTTTTTAGANDDVTITPTIGSEVGTDGSTYKYAEFSPNGAKSATVYYKVSSSDTETSGSFGTWNGSAWLQEDFNVSVPSNGEVSVDYTMPSDVGSTVKCSVYWPGVNSVDITKVVLHYGTSSSSSTTTQSGNTSSSNGQYTVNLNQAVDYNALPEDDKMIGWEWSQFGIPADETITKVVLNLSTTKSQIGKWQGAFGSSTSVAPGYWTQTEDMEVSFTGKTGELVWTVDSATAAIIQKEYGGMLKFGTWWIDCATFTIDSITVYTNASSSTTATTASTTKTTTTTTTTAKTTATTAKTTSTTAKQTTATVATVKPQESTVAATMYGDVNLDGRIDLTDAILLNKAVAGAVNLSAQQYANANVCTDDGVGSSDAIVLVKFLVQLIGTLPSA